MPIKATAVIRRETKVDPRRPHDKDRYAALQLLNENGKEYGVTRYLSGFQEVANLLQRASGVAYEQLQDRYSRYEKGEEVRISVTLESDEAIKNLGFDPKRFH